MSLFTLTPNDKQLSEALVDLQMRSCWSKPTVSVEIGLYDLLETVMRYGHQVSGFTWRDMIPEWRQGGPVFDHANSINTYVDSYKGWELRKQVTYIENILLGCKDACITLYTTDPDAVRDCFILDGIGQLQAIENFINDRLTVFDKLASDLGKPPITYTVLKDSTSFIGVSKKVTLSVYQLDSDETAIEHYLQRNLFSTQVEQNLASVYNLTRK